MDILILIGLKPCFSIVSEINNDAFICFIYSHGCSLSEINMADETTKKAYSV